jgi:hypothetical protein
VELGCQPEGGRFLQELRTDKEVRSLALTDLQGFTGGPHCSCQVAILTKPLGENGPQGHVGINDQNPPGMAAVIIIIRLSHKSLI